MARVLMMADFSGSFANKLLKGIVSFSQEKDPWVVYKLPVSLRDGGRMDEVLKFAVDWKADVIIGQFFSTFDVDVFKRHGIIAIAVDYQRKFPSICNVTGEYITAGRLCADYFIKKRVKNFAYFGLNGLSWSEESKEGFIDEVRCRVPGATMSVYELNGSDSMWRYDIGDLAAWLQGLPKPVGIMTCDDLRSFYLADSLKHVEGEELRIPEDVMILGVGNDETLCEQCSPSLSSLNLDTEEAGYNVARLIDELLSLPSGERDSKIRNLVVKNSYITTRRSTDSVVHHNPYVSKILRYIHSNITEHISVEDIVALVPMSRRLLENTFRREVGTSIYQYVIQVRVEKMKDLIVNGTSPVAAAEMLGMDYKIIARSFKKLTGMTPGEFVKASS